MKEIHGKLTWKYRFLSRMAFSVNKIVRVPCQSRSWFILYVPGGQGKGKSIWLELARRFE